MCLTNINGSTDMGATVRGGFVALSLPTEMLFSRSARISWHHAYRRLLQSQPPVMAQTNNPGYSRPLSVPLRLKPVGSRFPGPTVGRHERFDRPELRHLSASKSNGGEPRKPV